MSKHNYEIIKSSNMGFCFGVRRAVNMTEQALSEGKSVYILGNLIHNPQEVKRLIDKGARVIESLEGITGGTLIIRSHGVSSDEYNEALSLGLEIIDATCPYVRKVQHMAARLYKEGYEVIIAGEAQHPEVKGILGYCPGAIAVNSIDELKDIDIGPRTGLLAQTTQKFHVFMDMVMYLTPRAFELRVFNTICFATEERQKATCELTGKVDIMIVIGGRNSSNTNKLASICREAGIRTCHIEKADEIKEEWFSDNEKIGITAGSSTPEWLISEVIEKILSQEQEIEKNGKKK